MSLEILIAIAAGLMLPLQAATLVYVVSIERRLTRLETLQEVVWPVHKRVAPHHAG